MRVLITGSEGQVGEKLIKQCIDDQICSLALSKDQLDITDLSQISEILNEYRPSIIINAAAYTNVDSAEEYPEIAHSVNAQGPKNLASLCSNQSILLFHISTDYVFDGLKGKPYHEDDNPNPINVYGTTKLQGEENIKSLTDNYIILRTSWVFSDTGKNFMKTIMELSKKSEVLTIVGDQIGSPTSAESIANAILSICKAYECETFKPGTYHYSGEEFVSWFDFATQIVSFAKENGLINKIPLIKKISTTDYPTKSKKPMYSCLSSEKIGKTFGITPNNWRKDLENLISNLN